MLREVHHVDDYGADPTGVEPSDTAVDAAIDAADDGDGIALTNGTYYLAARHEIRKELVVCGSGGRIESDLHPGHGYHDPHPLGADVDGTQTESLYPIFAFLGERGERVGLAEPVPEGSDQVRVANPDGFAVGGGILLSNEDVGAIDRAWVGNRSRAYEPTVSTVREIEGDMLYLDVSARFDYAGDEEYHAYPIDFLDDCGFVECHFRNRDEPYWDEERGKVMGGFRHAMLQKYCRTLFVRGCSVRGYDTKMWVPIDVLEAQVVNPRVEAPTNVNGSHGEPLYIYGGTNVNIYNPIIRGARRAIDLQAGCKDVNVYNPDITGTTFLGLSYHHGRGEQVRGNLNVYGGRVHCKPTDPTQDDHGGEKERRWELQRGTGMRGTDANGRIRVVGTTFLVRHRGANCYGSGTIIDGCEFTTVPAGTGTSEPVLSITGEDVSVRNTVVRANRHGADHAAAIRIDGARNVDLDVELRGRFTGTPVVIDGGERLGLCVRSAATGGEEAVRICGAVRDLDLAGDAYNNAAGVAIAPDADVDHLRISGFTHRGEGETLRVAGEASVHDLRLDDVTSMHGGDIDLGGALVDGLWIRDSVFGSLERRHPKQGDAHAIVEGNRRRGGDRGAADD